MLVRLLLALFLVTHGAVHAIMFALPYNSQAVEDMGFNPSDSWLIGGTRSFALGFAVLVTGSFALGAVLFLLRAHWWPSVVIAASLLSVALLGLYMTKWWIAGFAINAVILVAAWRAWNSN